MSSELLSRRDFLKKVGLILGGVLITGPLLTKSLFGAGEKIASLNKGGDITPDEDLMREHGVFDASFLFIAKRFIG